MMLTAVQLYTIRLQCRQRAHCSVLSCKKGGIKLMMPKELISAGWVQTPCQFLVSPSSAGAELCGECEQEFSWLGKNSKRHCMFCGYLFHRHRCTRKVQVEGEFFRQRICSRCHYYRSTAEHKLKAGEEFECIGQCEQVNKVVISLCEDTAELILHWKDKEIKQTADLALVEVRKGFSHVHQHTAAGQYEPLRSFSLFLKDSLGEQSAYHLRASSALTCQLWVEGLKAANYVYHKMVEQENALEFYSDRAVKLPSRNGLWYRRLYLPSADMQTPPPSPPGPTPTTTGDDLEDEEWEDIASPLTPTGLFSNMTSPTSLYANSSGYQSDLSLSLCSSMMGQQQRTVHSLNFTSSCRQHTFNSRPHTAPSSGRKHWSSITPGANTTPGQGQDPFSPTCPCHFRVVPSQSLNLPSHSHNPSHTKPFAALDKCCEECKDTCRLAQEMLNF